MYLLNNLPNEELSKLFLIYQPFLKEEVIILTEKKNTARNSSGLFHILKPNQWILMGFKRFPVTKKLN